MRARGGELRTGLTTGTCAAAAAAAAARALAGEPCDAVDVELPDGERVTLAVESVERPREGCARAAVVKDAGDDPDVTDGMTVVVEVEVLDGPAPSGSADTPPAAAGTGLADHAAVPTIEFVAGAGVGTVTRAGLQLAPGEPAINPVPREMIAAAVRAVLPDGRLRVTVGMPGGEETARRTFNARLGIEGGLSVLGTSGRVIPKSEDAWLRSLLPQVDVALADGRDDGVPRARALRRARRARAVRRRRDRRSCSAPTSSATCSTAAWTRASSGWCSSGTPASW